MAYRSDSAPSEGEIVDKATTSRPYDRNKAVDSRRNQGQKRRQYEDSRHRSDTRRYDDRNDSRRYNRNDRYEPPEKRPRHDRSRSPARQSQSQNHHQSQRQNQDEGRRQGQEERRIVEEKPQQANVPENDVEEEVVDEAKLIEERRKRREALREKHRLLHKAMETESAQASPAASHPSSPMSLINDHQPTSAASPSVHDVPTSAASPSVQDGPSAADYEPAMDTDAPAGAPAVDYDENKEKDREVVIPKANDLDMFADDDDDDMFALEPQAGHKKEDGTQAVRIPEAKQLDRSLLDDWDDPEGYYRIILGELLDGRYHVQTNLGKGVFSAVVRAHDTKTDRVVAIKIIRTQESMYKAGMKEIEILQTIAEADPDDKKHLIRLERHFEHKGHLCMVFENLSINLREVLKKFGRDIGINIKAVRSYAQQMFLGLSLLKKCEILHADLKPDNVLVNESRSQLKIADLGSAMSADDNEITDVLVSRFYRAPEIMLGIKHDYAIDMWSIGCTLFELYTGKICFTGSTNNQMLKGIMECRGKIPNRMLKRSEFWAQHFDPDGTFLSQEVDNVTHREVVRRMNITRTVPAKELKSRLFGNSKGLSPADAKELNLFADLLDKCLAVDPIRRITPTDALKHPFIHRIVPHPIK